MIVVALTLITSCGSNDPVRPTPGTTTTTQRAWIGSYTSAAEDGDWVLDVSVTGRDLAGEIVFGSTSLHLWLTGVVAGDSLLFIPDSDHSFDPSIFSLRAMLHADGSLSGRMLLVSTGLDADVSGRELPRRTIDSDVTHEVPFPVIAMAHDGSLLWLSTSGRDYIRMDPMGALVDTIEIDLAPGLHWTSSELMFDGTELWGTYPITIIGPGGTINVADLLAFDENGRTSDSLRIGHRPHGLAYDGVNGWSLRGDPPTLIRFDATGAVTDSLHVQIPDANQLAFDGTHFWTLGWYLRRLYELDASGEVVSITDLPRAYAGSFAVGLAVEGGHLWYGEGLVGASTLHRMTIGTP